MNKRLLILILVLAVLIVILITMGILSYINKSIKNYYFPSALVIYVDKNGTEDEIGIIDFSSSTNGKLEITKSGKDADRLKVAWSELTKKSELSYVSEEMVNGTWSMYTLSVKPESKDYKWAIYDNLEREYGFIVKDSEK